MELRRYLFENRIKTAHLAKLIDYSPATLYSIIGGKQKAGKKIAKAIEKATNGQVTQKELMDESQPNKKKNEDTEQLSFL